MAITRLSKTEIDDLFKLIQKINAPILKEYLLFFLIPSGQIESSNVKKYLALKNFFENLPIAPNNTPHSFGLFDDNIKYFRLGTKLGITLAPQNTPSMKPLDLTDNEINLLIKIYNLLLNWKTKWDMQTTNIPVILKWQSDLMKPIQKQEAIDDFLRNYTINSQKSINQSLLEDNIQKLTTNAPKDKPIQLLYADWLKQHGGQAMLSFIPYLFEDHVFSKDPLKPGALETITANWESEKGVVTFNFEVNIRYLISSDQETTYLKDGILQKTQHGDDSELQKMRDEENTTKKSILEPLITFKGKCILFILADKHANQIIPKLTTLEVTNNAGSLLKLPDYIEKAVTEKLMNSFN